jgi:hypothetical protein
VIAGDADGSALGAGHHMGAESEALNSGANLSDVLLRGLCAHNDEHVFSVSCR